MRDGRGPKNQACKENFFLVVSTAMQTVHESWRCEVHVQWDDAEKWADLSEVQISHDWTQNCFHNISLRFCLIHI